MRLLSIYLLPSLLSPVIASQLSAPSGNGTDDVEPPTGRLRQRGETRQKAMIQSPAVVRKLSSDEGEKFWLDYWQFLDDVQSPGTSAGSGNHDKRWDVNGLSRREDGSAHLQAPYALHASGGSSNLARWIPRALAKRSFECPARSSACTSIDRPQSCCSEDTTCQIVEDSGLGDVGCCPGDECDGGLGSCGDGRKNCPNSPGGGCCMEGYTCVDEGCVLYFTETVIVTGSPPTSTSTSTFTGTTTAPQEPSESFEPPWRPTSNPTVTSEYTSTSTSADSPGCPTGFYACEAAYQGGCCRMGRDCQETSCPVNPSSTVVDGNGNTIVAPGVTGGAETTGSCANGWISCPADVGGGCCPSEYECGETSCTAAGPGETDAVGKVPAQDLASRDAVPLRWISWFLFSFLFFYV